MQGGSGGLEMGNLHVNSGAVSPVGVAGDVRGFDRRAMMKSALAAGFAFVAGCGRGERKPVARGRGVKNILFIVSDALRADMLGKTAAGVTVMPNIDRLASGGAAFTNCITPSSWTVFSVPGYLSSMPPLPCPLSAGEDAVFFPDSAVNIAEILSGAGWMTSAVIKNPWLYQGPELEGRQRALFARGFESYHTPIPDVEDNPIYEAVGGHRLHYAYEDAARATEQALNILKMRKLRGDDRRFFLYLHYMDTHEPYYPPAAYREKFVSGGPIPGAPDDNLTGVIRQHGRDRDYKRILEEDVPVLERAREMYTAGANYVDDQVGRVFDFLRGSGLYENTLIVFTSDHGEEFGEHGWIGHTRTLHREVLHVPIVMAGPGVEAGRVVDSFVSSLDIAPALLTLAGVDAAGAPFEGRAETLLDSGDSKDIISSTKYPPNPGHLHYISTSLTTKTGKKFIRRAHFDEEGGGITDYEHLFYDQRLDSGKNNNIAGEAREYCLSAAERIDRAIAARAGRAGMKPEMPEGFEEQFRSLGYLN